MGLLDSISAWFKKESADAKDVLGGLERDLDADLSAKERALNASPEERLGMVQDEITSGESSFDAVRDRIEGASAQADAEAEVAELARQDDASNEDDN